MQRPVAPILNRDIRFLVQFADGGGRYLAAPKGLGNILHTAHGNTGQVHLDERFLHAALSPAIPLNDGCFERDTLKARYMERDVSGGGGKVPVIVAAAVALAGLIALVPGRLG